MALPIVTTLNRADQPPLVPTLSHLAVVPVPPHNPQTLLLYTAGQVGFPLPTNPPTKFPETFREQAINALNNVAACLALKGATPRDIVKLSWSVVNYKLSMREELVEVLQQFFATTDGSKPHAPASTLVEVKGLALEKFLVEVDAVAAVAAE